MVGNLKPKMTHHWTAWVQDRAGPAAAAGRSAYTDHGSPYEACAPDPEYVGDPDGSIRMLTLSCTLDLFQAPSWSDCKHWTRATPADITDAYVPWVAGTMVYHGVSLAETLKAYKF